MSSLTVITGDCFSRLRDLPAESVQCCVTSPPYFGLRDYGVIGQIGLEESPAKFVEAMVSVFEEVRRVLKPDGTLWMNLGDSYAQSGVHGLQGANSQRKGRANIAAQRKASSQKAPAGLKPKDMMGIPWRVAFALQDAGWYLRQDIIWHKPNPMPESVNDRCTKAHEYLFLLSKSERYLYDADAIKETAVKGAANSAFNKGKSAEHQLGRSSDKERIDDGRRNKRSVWTVPTKPYSEAHFATYPPALITPCILAGTRPGDTVLDPFGGSGTTGMVALELGRSAVLIELNPEYVALIHQRCSVTRGLGI